MISKNDIQRVFVSAMGALAISSLSILVTVGPVNADPAPAGQQTANTATHGEQDPVQA